MFVSRQWCQRSHQYCRWLRCHWRLQSTMIKCALSVCLTLTQWLLSLLTFCHLEMSSCMLVTSRTLVCRKKLRNLMHFWVNSTWCLHGSWCMCDRFSFLFLVKCRCLVFLVLDVLSTSRIVSSDWLKHVKLSFLFFRYIRQHGCLSAFVDVLMTDSTVE